jgi:penicillin-binding protein 2
MDIFGNFSKLGGDRHKRRVEKHGYLNFSYTDTTLKPISKIETKSLIRSLFSLKVLIVFVFCILVFKLFVLQVFEGEANQKKAEGNRTRPRIIEATRGLITDKNGVWLARNKPSFALAVYPSDLPRKMSEREALYKKISDISGLSVDTVKGESEKNGLLSLNEVILKENISHEEALLLEERIAGMRGVFIAKKPLREYVAGNGLAHILGYTSIVSKEDIKKSLDYYPSDKVGKIGIEAEYEKYLKGTHGIEQIEVDSKYNIVKVLVKEENRDPVAGNDLVLNLDMDLQQKTAEYLRAGIDKATGLVGSEITGGAAIVMDVNTGGILSLVSFPDYDNNLFSGGISTNDYKKLIEDDHKHG